VNTVFTEVIRHKKDDEESLYLKQLNDVLTSRVNKTIKVGVRESNRISK
jgi:hypothetical protein